MATTIGLFCFHKHVDLCRSRVELLRHLNPGVRLFGLYGGDPDGWMEMQDLEASGLEVVHANPGTWSDRWNWKNTDLAVLNWYRLVGRAIPFDRVHVIQWDLLFFCSLERAYPDMDHDTVGLTGLTFLQDIAPAWHWTTDPAARSETDRLLVDVRTRFGFQGRPMACIGPGYSLPRRFLERYCGLDVSDIGHDELRLPLFAAVLGFRLADTGFYPRWADPEVERTFNANGDEIDPTLVALELASKNGRRVFHPCRQRFDAEVAEKLLRMVIETDEGTS